jgi:hypothetical protein
LFTALGLEKMAEQRNGVFWRSVPRGYDWEDFIFDNILLQFVKKPPS